MQGQIQDFSVETNTGVISGDDGNRYTFTGDQWKDAATPAPGMRVDFEGRGVEALGVYRAMTGAGAGALPRAKSKVAAGLLGIFAGGLGVHKFYLGYKGAGFFMLGMWVLGMLTIELGIGGLILPVVNIIGLIEGIIYLTRSKEKFEQLYVVQRREWF